MNFLSRKYSLVILSGFFKNAFFSNKVRLNEIKNQAPVADEKENQDRVKGE